MATILSEALTFDDVVLEPQYSDIRSRFNGQIDLSAELLPGLILKTPIISSNMDTVSEGATCKAMEECGGIGIVHRFLTPHKQVQEMRGLRHKIVCIGTSNEEFSRFEFVSREFKDDLTAVAIDIAHAHSSIMTEQIIRVKHYTALPIIAGNVSTYSGAYFLFTQGVQVIKIGQGPGSLCTTRIQTGNGIPQLTTILEAVRAREDFCREYPERAVPTIICDGGIRCSGDIVKALAAGADVVMLGGLLAGTEEAPGDIVVREGKEYKRYRGMASREAQLLYKGEARSIEGAETYLPLTGSVKKVIDHLVSGLRSGMSYQGAHNLEELREGAVFWKQTTAGRDEGLPHALLRKIGNGV